MNINQRRRILSYSMLVYLGIMLINSFLAKGVTNSFYFYVMDFRTDKTQYFLNETIIITAKWELVYDDSQEVSYMQIQMLDVQDKKIWNSGKCFVVGTIEVMYGFPLFTLGIPIPLNNSSFHIKLFNYYKNLNSGDLHLMKLGTLEIIISDGIIHEPHDPPVADLISKSPDFTNIPLNFFGIFIFGALVFGYLNRARS